MEAKAQLGQWVLIAIIAVTALIELAIAGVSLQAAVFKGSQIGRVVFTGWLLWQVWDGAGWARWLMAGLFLGAALLAVALGFGAPGVRDRPEVLAIFVAIGTVFTAFSIGLASPWVAAYQAARRNLRA